MKYKVLVHPKCKFSDEEIVARLNKSNVETGMEFTLERLSEEKLANYKLLMAPLSSDEEFWPVNNTYIVPEDKVFV